VRLGRGSTSRAADHDDDHDDDDHDGGLCRTNHLR
jgi:hypothetical protein